MAEEDLSRLKIDKPEIGTGGRKGRKAGRIAAIAGVVAIAAILYFGGFLRWATTVDVTSVSQAYPSQSLALLNASGYVVAQRKAAVASKITGRLIELLVVEGDPVKANQVIARLENADALASRDQAAANLLVARARLEEVRAELSDATLTYDRFRRLLERGAVSRSQFDTADARHKRTLASVSSAEAAVAAAEATLRSAEVLLDYTSIRAPFDAVVLTKDADVGDIVTPLGAAANAKAAVVTIADMDSLQVEVDVSETGLSLVKAGQPCEIQLDALPDARFPGEVSAIVPTADRSKASVKVKVRFDEPDPRILPEMSAKVSFLSRPSEPGERKPCVAVPASVPVQSDAGEALFVVRDGRAWKTPVRLGMKFGEFVEVLDGVKAGDSVVIAPPDRLRNGDRVTPEGE